MIAVLDARPGREHLKTRHGHDFIAAVPALSTARPGSLIQLNEIALD